MVQRGIISQKYLCASLVRCPSLNFCSHNIAIHEVDVSNTLTPFSHVSCEMFFFFNIQIHAGSTSGFLSNLREIHLMLFLSFTIDHQVLNQVNCNESQIRQLCLISLLENNVLYNKYRNIEQFDMCNQKLRKGQIEFTIKDNAEL